MLRSRGKEEFVADAADESNNLDAVALTEDFLGDGACSDARYGFLKFR